jgi:hypothetical protein
MVNTSQQVGGSVGTALLSTLFASSVASYTATHLHTRGLANAATIHGYTTAFSWAAGIFALGLLLALVILPSKVQASAPVPTSAADDRLGAGAATATTSATPIFVSGPCCHFSVTLHAEPAVGQDGTAEVGARASPA